MLYRRFEMKIYEMYVCGSEMISSINILVVIISVSGRASEFDLQINSMHVQYICDLGIDWFLVFFGYIIFAI